MRRGRIWRSLGALAFWLALWAALALIMDLRGRSLLMPPPGEVAARLLELAGTGEFWRYTLSSIGRVTLGLAIAAALGVGAAALCVRFPAADALLAPAMTVVKSTPVASFAILVLIWLPRDLVPVCISALMVLPVVWANVCAGIRGTDRALLELAQVCSLGRWRVLSRIYLPSVLPGFAAACRSAIGFGWKAGIAAEVLTVPRESMGRMIYESRYYLETTDLFAWTLAVILLSVAIEKLLLGALGRLSRGRGGVPGA